ncbi:DUF1707 domain-containing protein [Streptomyces sp. MN03-5084-2B]|nr:DUF1707 domain-containing protein [Streptomyces sp. MN03-5084-2B]
MTPHETARTATLRASHSDRQRAARLLQDALSQGMLDLGEYTERSAAAANARTRGDLAPLLDDLPAAHEPPGAAVETPPLVLKAGMGDVERTGVWDVPSRIDAKCSSGDVRIDFTEAVCPHREVTLNLECGWGTILVVVPRGWTLVFEAMATGAGDITDTVTAPPEPGQPVLRAHCKVGAGNIRFRHPR